MTAFGVGGMNRAEVTEQTAADIDAVARISAVPTILKVISEITGFRLALVARVTPSTWAACAVLDLMEFGLEVGGRLDVATTLCSQVRDTHETIIIEHASTDPTYCNHPTPKMYGFESYVATPIFRPNGEYFGNVCALDSNPLTITPHMVGMMKLFAELISLQLSSEEDAERQRVELIAERETARLRDCGNSSSRCWATTSGIRSAPLSPALDSSLTFRRRRPTGRSSSGCAAADSGCHASWTISWTSRADASASRRRSLRRRSTSMRLWRR